MSDGTDDDRPDDVGLTNDGELVSRLELIESQPLDRRAEGFDQLAADLLTELQRSDHEGTAAT